MDATDRVQRIRKRDTANTRGLAEESTEFCQHRLQENLDILQKVNDPVLLVDWVVCTAENRSGTPRNATKSTTSRRMSSRLETVGPLLTEECEFFCSDRNAGKEHARTGRPEHYNIREHLPQAHFATHFRQRIAGGALQREFFLDASRSQCPGVSTLSHRLCSRSP